MYSLTLLLVFTRTSIANSFTITEDLSFYESNHCIKINIQEFIPFDRTVIFIYKTPSYFPKISSHVQINWDVNYPVVMKSKFYQSYVLFGKDCKEIIQLFRKLIVSSFWSKNVSHYSKYILVIEDKPGLGN